MTRKRPAVDVDVDADRTSLLLTPVAGTPARLVLRLRGTDAAVDVEATRDVTSVLDARLLSALTPGRWDVYVGSDGGADMQARADVGLLRTVRLITRHAVEAGDRGVAPYKTVKGGLTLLVERLVPGAEVCEVWPRHGRISLAGRLLWATGGAGRLVLRQRAGEAVLEFPAQVGGSHWSTELHLDALPRRRSQEAEIWDAWLQVEGVDEALRLGAHSDDVKVRHRAVRYPAQQRDGEVVEPYWTVKGNVSIRLLRAD